MILSIKNLSKTYENGIKALVDVNLDIPMGMFGLLGPNGAGKSTLMRTLATLQEADTGTAMLGDLDVLREKEQVRRILGYLPQEFGVYPKFSAEAMLGHFAVLKGISDSRERKKAVDEILEMTNLNSVRKQKLGTFSGGMRQRFGVAQALLGNPKLIIVDEPTAGLDPQERHRFLNLLSEIGENVVVILSTHIVEDVRELCSQMAIIDKGLLLMTGDPRSLTAELEGKIWRKSIGKDQVDRYEASMTVISKRLLAGRPSVHVLSDVPPGDGFEPVVPDLEDVYLVSLRQARHMGC